jgi:hypothetical protein
MRMAFCLLLALLACSKKQDPEYYTACGLQELYLAQDASGKALEIADARKGTKPVGFPIERPVWISFRRGAMGSVEFEGFDVGIPWDLDYTPGSPTAKVLSAWDGDLRSINPIQVEGSPPQSVVFGYMSHICAPGGQVGICNDMTEEKMVYATFSCTEELDRDPRGYP